MQRLITGEDIEINGRERSVVDKLPLNFFLPRALRGHIVKGRRKNIRATG